MPWITFAIGAIGAFAAWRWLNPRRGPIDRAVAVLAWAPGVGLGLLSLFTFFGIFAGWRWVGAWLFVVLASALALSLLWRRWRDERSSSADRERPQGARPGRAMMLLLLVAVVTVAGLGLAYAEYADSRPHGAADAVNIWVSRSLMVYGAPDDLPNRLELLRKGHPDYPIMLPTALAGQYALAGSTNLAISRVTGLLFVLGLGGMMFFALDRLAGRVVALAATSLVWVTPAILRWGFLQVADVPLAYLSLGAAVGLAAQLEGGRRLEVPPVLAGLFLGLLPWTKNEGSAIALALTLAFVLVLWKSGSRHGAARKCLPWVALGAAPGVVATVLFKVLWVSDKEIGRFFASPLERLLDLERWQAVLAALGSALAPNVLFERWGLAWGLLILASVVALVQRRRQRSSYVPKFLAVAIALTLGAYGLAYLLSPYDLDWHVSQSLDRLLIHVFPLALVAVTLGLAPLLALEREPGDTGVVDRRRV